jgi:hypothetical protein
MVCKPIRDRAGRPGGGILIRPATETSREAAGALTMLVTLERYTRAGLGRGARRSPQAATTFSRWPARRVALGHQIKLKPCTPSAVNGTTLDVNGRDQSRRGAPERRHGPSQRQTVTACDDQIAGLLADAAGNEALEGRSRRSAGGAAGQALR